MEDNGIGRAAAQNLGTNKNGKGSKLMQERLEILQEKQGEKYRLQITDLTENGANRHAGGDLGAGGKVKPDLTDFQKNEALFESVNIFNINF
jgi:hypothetical protein